MAEPVFMKQLDWSPAVLVQDLVVGRVQSDGSRVKDTLPDKPGLYFYTSNAQGFSIANALYVGKTDGPTTSLKSRVGVYLRHFGGQGNDHKHKAARMLKNYYVAHRSQMYLRWAVCAIAQEIEGYYHEIYGPKFISRYETPIHSYDALIDPYFLGKSSKAPANVIEY